MPPPPARFLLPGLLLALAACAGPHATARGHLRLDRDPVPGELFHLDGTAASYVELVAAAREAGYVLLGESHDSSCDHQVQGTALAALVAAGLRPPVGLEMLTTEAQPALDAWRAAGAELDALPAAVGWQKQWGVDFALYRPALGPVVTARLFLAGLNLPSELVRRAGRGGLEALAPEERAKLPPEVIPAPEEQARALDADFAHHPSTGDEAAEARRSRFLLVQALWDTQLARSAFELGRAHGAPVVVLAGAGHVRHGHGIEHRLARFDPGAGVVSLVPWRGDEGIEPGVADLVFYCPARE